MPFIDEVVVGSTVSAGVGWTLTCAEGNTADVNDAVSNDTAVCAPLDGCSSINVVMGDPTAIVGPGNNTEFITVVAIAMDTSTADVTLTSMLEDSTTELWPKKMCD